MASTPLPAWLQLALLAGLVAWLVSVGARQLGTPRYQLSLLNGGAPQLSAGKAASSLSRDRQYKAPIPFPVIGKK